MEYFAHSKNRGERWEPLHEHLTHVAQLAADFAKPFGASEQAFLAGLLHDLGKYSERFNRRLNGAAVSLDHWSLGAAAAARWGKAWGLIPALAIQGHHVGLGLLTTDWKQFSFTLENEIAQNQDRHALASLLQGRERLEADGLRLEKVSTGLRISPDQELVAGDMLDVRMLFSALVDADFLETESHFEGDALKPRRPRPPGPIFTVESAWNALRQRLEGVRKGSVADSLRTVREQLLTDCLTVADSPTGAFTLTAPTGAGKTLAMLAFALAHARKNRLRRVVLAMPFLNIVDQTAGQYEAMFCPATGFADHFVLEQHSLAEDLFAEPTNDAARKSKQLRRQLAENWDAPIILTTTVQLLESLHAHKPSRCRKLHRLAEAVILLDEAQTLPPHLAPLTLATLSRLTDPQGPYRSSVVFATATQPAFAALGQRVAKYYRSGWYPREIVRDPAALFAAAKARTQIEWREEHSLTLPTLAHEMVQSPRCLCIVNLKRHAIALASQLQQLAPDGLFHLSTNMCPAHREQVLAAILARLNDPAEPITRVVATQCVEAGVDMDFRPPSSAPDLPVLFRALAPLDSIAQAAGRANRNGLSERARAVVFQIDDAGKATYPPGYEHGIESTVSLLSELRNKGRNPNGIDLIHDPEWIAKYYRKLYDIVGRDQEPSRDERPLHDALQRGDFAEVARLYKLIDTAAINVIVPYDRRVFRDLRRELQATTDPKPGYLRSWKQRARKHAVAIRPPAASSNQWAYLEPIRFGQEDLQTHEASWFWPVPSVQYDQVVGLKWPDEGLIV